MHDLSFLNLLLMITIFFLLIILLLVVSAGYHGTDLWLINLVHFDLLSDVRSDLEGNAV